MPARRDRRVFLYGGRGPAVVALALSVLVLGLLLSGSIPQPPLPDKQWTRLGAFLIAASFVGIAIQHSREGDRARSTIRG